MSAPTTADEVDVTTEAAAATTASQQQHQLKSLSLNGIDNTDEDDDTSMMAILTLPDITELPPESGSDSETDKNNSDSTTYRSTTIPKVKFIDDIPQYVQSFEPKIVTAELLIGAYTQLHTKYKLSETSLLRKRTCMW